MPVSAVIHSVAASSGSKEIILAIAGGTMLTAALTRPRLRWVETLTEDSETNRLWAERGLTVFAFVMGGYAWATLFVILQRQLGSESAALLKGASILLILYAWLTHFEPFAREWRLSGGLAAAVLYTGAAFLAGAAGVMGAEVARHPFLHRAQLPFLATVAAVTATFWVFYKLIPKLEARLSRTIDTTNNPG